MSANTDVDAAKNNLTDTLTNARDVTASAVRNDIAPAVAAAVGAAIEASAPLRAEAANRAGGAIDALINSEIVEHAQEAATEAARKSGKRRYMVLGATVAGLGVVAMKIRKSKSGSETIPPSPDLGPVAS